MDRRSRPRRSSGRRPPCRPARSPARPGTRASSPGAAGSSVTAAEGLPHPDPELVAVGVREPPDPLAVRRQHAVRRPVRPVRDLPLLAGRPVPGVQLVRPRRVRDEQGAVAGRPPPSPAATTRGARKRFSQSGTALSRMASVFCVMAPFCAAGGTPRGSAPRCPKRGERVRPADRTVPRPGR